MRESERRDLEGRLAALTSNEKQKLYKRAAAARQREQPKKGRDGGRGRDFEDRGAPAKGGRSLDEWALVLLRDDDPVMEEAPRDEGDRRGIAVWIGPASCSVREGEAIVECAIPPDLRGAVAAGDEVAFSAGEGARVTSVRPRRTVLSRPDPHNPHRELVLAANVDVVVIVAALVSPPLRPGLVDRFLVAVQRGGAEAAICASKADLVPESDRAGALSVLDPYVEMGLPVLCVSTATGEGIDAVRSLVRGRTSALVGHSGVGKSSLANALHPDLAAVTGAVTEHHGRGRHTTTSSSLYVLPDGSRVVDTPGIRSFGLWDVGPGELGRYFPDLAEHGDSCRFRDCSHTHEPMCGVRVAVEIGALPRARYEAYQRILETIRG